MPLTLAAFIMSAISLYLNEGKFTSLKSEKNFVQKDTVLFDCQTCLDMSDSDMSGHV